MLTMSIHLKCNSFTQPGVIGASQLMNQYKDGMVSMGLFGGHYYHLGSECCEYNIILKRLNV